jgi:hypothetical protein
MTQVAALFVETRGCYFGLPDVDPWDKERDARLYAGPHAVVAHPPCERWGRYWGGAPTTWPRKVLGDDGGCFEAALNSVRRWGGVLEHPEGSHAWRHFQLIAPPRSGGWVVADFDGGWTCCVEQGAYGHRARKATWLYVCGVLGLELPSDPSSLDVAGEIGAAAAGAQEAPDLTGGHDAERRGGRCVRRQGNAARLGRSPRSAS